MRKLISIFLLLNYLVTVLAIGINVHYCGKQIIHVKVVGLRNDGCDCKEQKMPRGCCKNEIHICHTDNHLNSSPVIFNSQSPKVTILSPVFPNSLISSLPDYDARKDIKPPIKFSRFCSIPTTALFILYEDYRI